MAPLKSTIVRTLRSNAVQTPRRSSGVVRGLTVTAKNATTETVESRQSTEAPWAITELRSFPIQSFQIPQQYQHHKPQTDTFDALLNTITHSLSTTSKPHLPTLHNLLRLYISDATHWSKYAHANAKKKYTRNLVCEVPGVFNLLLLVWTPGMASPVHDHANSHCLMKILKGQLRESRYAMPSNSTPDSPLVETARSKFGVDKVAYISDQIGLHEITNPHPTEYAVSLHLYTPPNAAMYGCHVFDPETGESKHVIQGAYDSVGGILTGRT